MRKVKKKYPKQGHKWKIYYSPHLLETLFALYKLFLFLTSEQLGHAMPTQRRDSYLGGSATEAANCFTLSELKDATKDLEKKVGSGGFGVVYYGKLADGKEIAVKVLTSNSFQGKREFSNEVSFRHCILLNPFSVLIPYRVCSVV